MRRAEHRNSFALLGRGGRERGPFARAGLAPVWHTVALASLIVVVACTGLFLQHGGLPARVGADAATSGSRIVSQYLPLLLVNCSLTAYCCAFRGWGALREWVGPSPHGVIRELGLAVVLILLIQLVELGFTLVFGVRQTGTAASLLPLTLAERLSWVLVAVGVGFCEEVVYRGYLQAQLSAFSGSARLGIALQAALFGLAHADQGLAVALRVFGYGLLLGGVVYRRGTLWAAIFAHIGLDLAAAFLR